MRFHSFIQSFMCLFIQQIFSRNSWLKHIFCPISLWDWNIFNKIVKSCHSSALTLPNVISLSLSFFHGHQGLNVSPMSLTLSPAPFHLRLYGLSTLTLESERHPSSSFLFQGLCTAAPFSFFRSELKCHILKKGFLTILTRTLNTEVLSHTVLFVFFMVCISI